MTEKDIERFSYCMAALSEAFSSPVTPQKIEIYFKALEDLNIEDIERATWTLIRERKFSSFPQVAEIREAAFGNLHEKAIIALKKVEEAMKNFGGGATVVFDDPVIHMVLSRLHTGNWDDLCKLSIHEWNWLKKEFIEMYKTFAKSPVDYPPKLIGFHEHQNRLNGFHEYIPKPVFVGDRKKAEAILHSKEKYALESHE